MKNLSESDYLISEFKKLNNLFLLNKFDAVIDKAKKIIKKFPTQTSFYNLLALSYRESGKILLAEETLNNALKISPNNQSVMVNLGATYRVLLEFEKSEIFFKKVLSINSKNIHALVNYANLKRDTNDYNESIKLYESAYDLENNNETILINLAGVYQIVGKFNKSQKLLEKLININEKNSLAHKMLSVIKKYKINDIHQSQMISILKKNELSSYNSSTLCFAISKSYEDQKNYKESSNFFIKANKIQKEIHKKYSVEQEIKLFNNIKNIFERTDFEKYPNYINEKKLIFIVGLPRSGTTLAHQILAAHSKVQGAGEMIILDQFFMKNIYNKNFTSLFKKFTDENNDKIKEIINNYFSKIHYIKTDKKIILDKNPLNFQWLGFIRILFPKSKIIHCTRNLNDTALSIYKNEFEINSLLWSNEQDNLVKYIEIYLDLMKFWNKNIPNFIYNLNYESLIKNEENQIKELISFCELKWEKDCLKFNEKSNPIKTVSITQARNPIYKTSLNSFINYYDYLEMFKKIEKLK